MYRKLGFLVAAAVAVFALTGPAAATGGRHAMTAFEKDMAHVGRTPQSRASVMTLNFGMEQDVQGFFALDADETTFWAAVTGVLPEIRGTYIVDNRGLYHLDLASSVTATPTDLTIVIRPDAVWFSPGHGTTPVTAHDYAYTYNLITDTRNPVASTTGYSNINPANPYTIVNAHKIVFHFSTPFADFRDLFGYILPSDYLPSVNQMGANNGAIFNQVWRDCVCTQTIDNGNVVDGDPVTDGPFYMDSYIQGQGVVIKRTPQADWYGHFPALTQINFVRVTPGATEVNALQGGQIDAAYPNPSAALAPLQNDSNFVVDVKNGFVAEHWDFNEANPNLAHTWMRRAIALGMDRPALIQAVYAPYIASALMPLNNPLYEIGPNAIGLNAYFQVWNYDPTHALTILKNHCTGGPDAPSSSNTKVWQCPDGAAQFDWYSTTEGARVQSGQLFQQQLMSIGVKLVLHNVSAGVLFGSILPGALSNSCVTNHPCGTDTYDIAEYAWVGGVDPSGLAAHYECYDGQGNGAGNLMNFCNPTIDNLLKQADNTFPAGARTSLYERVAQIVSNKVYVVPLYARPVILIHRQGVCMPNSNSPVTGPTWNVEYWRFC